MWDGGRWEKGGHVDFLGLVLSGIALASQASCTSFIPWSAQWVENDLRNSTERGVWWEVCARQLSIAITKYLPKQPEGEEASAGW